MLCLLIDNLDDLISPGVPLQRPAGHQQNLLEEEERYLHVPPELPASRPRGHQPGNTTLV